MLNQTRKKILNAKKIVIKIGSSTLTTPKGLLDKKSLANLATQISKLSKDGKKIIIVSSGSIVAGSKKLGLVGKIKTIPQKQAAAAVGQGLLIDEYKSNFDKFKLNIAQVLLTRDIIANRKRYVNARNTLNTLINYKVIPIINENDTVAVDELKVGDNDNLSALVASLIGADLLIQLTDADGLCTKHPKEKDSCLIETVEQITKEIEEAATPSAGDLGVGGMATKVESAKVVTREGIPMLIANGRKKNVLTSILKGEKIGTLFLPAKGKMDSRKRWIAHGQHNKGKIILDEGAAKAIREKGSSLLAVGVKKIEGKFDVGDTVGIFSPKGEEIARGLTNYSNEELKKIQGSKTSDIQKILGYKYKDEVIHRDDLIVI